MTDVYVDPEAELDAKLHDQIRSILEQKAIEVESTAKRLVVSGGGGRLYTTRFFMRGGKLFAYGSRPPHRASAPGSPPSSDTGRLLGSIEHSMGEDSEGQYGRVTAGAYYSRYLELGTSRMAPRPFLRPALFAVVH